MLKNTKKILLLILYIILGIILLYMVLYFYKNFFRRKELFNQNILEKYDGNRIYSLVLMPHNENEESIISNRYYGTHIINKNQKMDNSILYTDSISSEWILNNKFKKAYNNYRKINNIPSSKDIIPYNITFTKIEEVSGKFKYYLIIIMMEKNNTIKECKSGYSGCIYNIYKLNIFDDIDKIKLTKITDFKNEKRTFTYILKNPSPLETGPTYLAVNHYDGFIYENDSNINEWFIDKQGTKWRGPIGNSNIDEPRMEKIMYDKDNFLIGISKDDNNIYRKKGLNFKDKRVRWDKKKINKIIDQDNTTLNIKTYDLLYDTDGCLIATTSNGILKQTDPEFSSGFVKIETYNYKRNEILNNIDILQYKTGCDFYDFIFQRYNNTIFDPNFKFIKNLKDIYELKKEKIDSCRSNNQIFKEVLDNNSEGVVDLQNRNSKINNIKIKLEEINKYL